MIAAEKILNAESYSFHNTEEIRDGGVLCSIITPAYNCEKTIKKTVSSVMEQTEPNWELIVIDDASSDGTASILKELASADSRIRYLQNPQNIGVAETRNRGLKEARGAYIAFLDGDDWWASEKLETQISFMRNTCCHISFTAYYRVDAEGETILKTIYPPEKMDLKAIYRKNEIGLSTSMIETSLARTARFKEEEPLEDFVYWMDLMQNGQAAYSIDDPLAYYRAAPASRSGNKLKMAAARWKTLRKTAKLPLWKAFSCFVYYAVKSVLYS